MTETIHQNQIGRDPIAIIGMSCRFPGASNIEELWKLLTASGDAICSYPGGRFEDIDRVYEQAQHGRSTRIATHLGGFLTDIDRFDAQFFEISPREAIYVDPQHRLLLEVAWEALEDAGQIPESLRGSKTGVFTGIWANDYETYLFNSTGDLDFYAAFGAGRAAASGRVSFAFGLQGPSITVDTACSSSLVAIHLACQSLWSGEIGLALAGGANVILASRGTELYTEARMLSPDGRCKFGDASADGFVRSEGAAIVVLKRLSEALADSDPVYATICGTAVNNDGRSGGLLLTPSWLGQQDMLKAAWKDAGICAENICYIEAHGTGTSVGDPIEIHAIGQTLAEAGIVKPCPIGSIKTNIGHTESAAGVAGLIKATLSLKHRIIPRSLHFNVPNPKIRWSELPVKIQTEPMELFSDRKPLIAGVNSFGLTGTNAHVVIEAFQEKNPIKDACDSPRLLTISASTSEALDAMRSAYLEFLRQPQASHSLRDICYTAAVRRSHHTHRAAIVARTLKEAQQSLEAAVLERDLSGMTCGVARQGKRRIVFVAPGQGSQWVGMGRELFAREPVFRDVVNRCDAAIHAETGWSVVERVFGTDAESYLSQIDVVQPALFTLSMAFAALWRSWGVEPDAVVGHSMGEIAAAQIAGILSLEDAAKIICLRSRLMRHLSGHGSMAMVELPMRDVEGALRSRNGSISVAASNSPYETVISGESAVVQELLSQFEARNVFCRPIKVDVASHSAQVEPILSELVQSLTNIQPRDTEIPMLSTVTGELASGLEMSPDYWACNLRQPVLFAKAVQTLIQNGHDVFVELSPHPILTPAIQATVNSSGSDAIVIASTRREQPERAAMLAGLGELYTNGHPINWKQLFPAESQCVSLPHYTFQRERCWFEPEVPSQPTRFGHPGKKISPLLGHAIESSLQPEALLWETELNATDLSFLEDHQVLGSVVFPASAHIEMALEAARATRPGESFDVASISLLSAVYIPEKDPQKLQIALVPNDSNSFTFEIRSRGSSVEAQWILHSSGRLSARDTIAPNVHGILPELLARCPIQYSSEDHYMQRIESGLHYGPTFQLVEEVWVGENESVCRIRNPAAEVTTPSYIIDPALLDCCFQTASHVVPQHHGFHLEDTYLPVSIRDLCMRGDPALERILFAHAQFQTAYPEKGMFQVGLHIMNETGNTILTVGQMDVQRVAQEKSHSTVPLFSVEWVQEPVPEREIAAEAHGANWLVFSDHTGVGDDLRVFLESLGGRCILVKPGRCFRETGAADFEINPAERSDLDRLLRKVLDLPGALSAVIHLWSCDQVWADDSDLCSLLDSQAVGTYHIPLLIQAITKFNMPQPPRLWIVTRGAAAVNGDAGQLNLTSAPLWGMGCVAAREHPEMRGTLVDLSAIFDSAEVLHLARSILSHEREDRIAFRGKDKYVMRYVRLSRSASEIEAAPLGEGEEYEIALSAPGSLDNLELRVLPPVFPDSGQIAIEVVAAGLNFIDVTKVMGIFPGLALNSAVKLGTECAGRVVAIDETVTEFQVGDEVIAITPSTLAQGMLASRVCVSAELVVRKPPYLSFEEAATIPIAYLTAHYALNELAHLKENDWVLIHAAAGGVGLAAIQIAKQKRAKIIATASAVEKHEYLRSIGVSHVFSSRSLDFVGGVMEVTNGRGVDIVLNSLTGEFIPKSLELLAPYGRFIELGKRDIYEDRRIGLKPFRRNLSYYAVDLAAAIEEKRSYVVRLLHEVMHSLENGDWDPLPVQTFPAFPPSDPFRFMAQAKHIGKIAVLMQRDVQVLPAIHSPLFAANATYLITGGLGGVGLAVAEWMAAQGARHLVLISRRPPSQDAEQALRRMRRSGALVLTEQVDVSNEEQVPQLIKMIRSSMPPLRGVIHAAAAIDDALIMDLSPERFLTAMRPKVIGAWNLHNATLKEDLDFFILFSSIAAVHPAPGHGSYAAANAFLDSFSHYRRALKLPTMSINWGGWDDIGLLKMSGTKRSQDAYLMEGMRAFSRDEALDALSASLTLKPVQTLALAFDAKVFAEFHKQDGIPPVFSHVVSMERHNPGEKTIGSELLEKLIEIDSGDARRKVLEAYLQDELSRVLRISTSRIGREKSFSVMGLDSLMALEFIRRINPVLGMSIPATAVFKYPTIKLLSELLDSMLWASRGGTNREPISAQKEEITI